MTETPATGSTQSGTTPEYVGIEDASDADLDAFLANAGKDEQLVEADPQPTPEPAQTGAEQPSDETTKPVTRADFDKLAKQLEGLELLNKRRTSDIGETKRRVGEIDTAIQKLASFIQQNSEGLDDLHLEKPREAVERQLQVIQAKKDLANLAQARMAEESQAQARALLEQHAPNGFDAQFIAQMLMEEDQLPEEFVRAFAAAPERAALPETLIQMAKRAEAVKENRQLKQSLAQLYHYAKQLIDEKQAAPQKVLSNIQSAMRSGPSVTGGGGGVGGVTGRSLDVTTMSDAELQELLGG